MLIIKKEDVWIKLEERKRISKGIPGVRNQGCWDTSQYNVPWQDWIQ